MTGRVLVRAILEKFSSFLSTLPIPLSVLPCYKGKLDGEGFISP